MRLVFFASGDFALPTLDALARAHDVRAVVTSPPRPAGRGGKTRPTPVHARAEELALPVITPDTPNTPDFALRLAEMQADLAVVVAYGYLIKKPLLAVPKHGFINLHASLLPAYRGAAPVPWAIRMGEAESGVTVFQLDERFDTGGILTQTSEPILPDDTSGTYLARLAPIGAEAVLRAATALAAGTALPKVQDSSQASSAPKLRREDGLLDWSCPVAELGRLVQAFQPWPVAYTVLSTVKGPLRVNVLALAPAPCPAGAAPAAPGTVLAANADSGLVVMAGDGPARLTRLQPEGKKAMPDVDFLRGTRLEGTP